MTASSFMAQLGAKLVDAGFPILPIQPGSKKPGVFRRGAWRDYPDWSRHGRRETTDHEVDVWGNWPEAGIGIATGRVIGIDIDVLSDPQLAKRIEDLAREMLGDTPALRIGRSPKRLLVYRADRPFKGFKRPPIDVLGLGQQFVAYGLHPETGQPYDWPLESLAEITLDDLPRITEAQARAFADAAIARVPPELQPARLPHAHDVEAASGALGEPRGTLEAITAALEFIPNPDLDYDSWVRIGLAIKGALGEPGWPLFEAWSGRAAKNVPATTEQVWRGLKPARIGAGTLYKLALEAGWEPAPSLQLNGALATNGAHPAKAMLQALKAPAPRAPAQASPASPPKAPPMPAGWNQVGGVIAEMMDLMERSAKRPQPVLALGASLVAVGALMGRKYRTTSNARSNLYVVGIAESGAGKNHSRMVINEIFSRAGLQRYLGGNKIASGAGLLNGILRQPAILFQLDEFGMFLSAAVDRKRSPRYLCEILDLLTELYTTSGTTYFGTEYAHSQAEVSRRAIHQPCVCVYGTTTPIHFWQALQATNVADGSLARFLILQTEEDFPESNDDFGSIDPPQELIERLLLIHQGGGQLSGNLADVAGVDEVTPMPRRVPINEQARAVFRALDRDLLSDLRAAHGSGFASILARIEENASKLALIRAVSRDPVEPEITGGDAEWGILIAQHCARQTIREASIRVSENAIESNHKRALQILQGSGPGGMPKSEFTRRTQFMDARQRDGVLQTLVDAQMIEVQMIQGARRPICLIKVLENNEL
ncbi:MAG: bifunctional DNA primase/polymerase [Candidatus Accumulibacter similis]|nr:MAG: bifunctional DNA primase/polymerase [Candidatus Accumulibacter similis]